MDPVVYLAREFEKLKKAQRDKGSTPQLGTSSMHNNGSIPAYAPDDTLRQTIGYQYDGTTTISDVNGPLPPAPTKPTVVLLNGAVRVVWDGAFFNSSVAPEDLARIDIRIIPTSTTDPLMVPPAGLLLAQNWGEASLPIEPGEYFLALIAWTTSGKYAISPLSDGFKVDQVTFVFPPNAGNGSVSGIRIDSAGIRAYNNYSTDPVTSINSNTGVLTAIGGNFTGLINATGGLFSGSVSIGSGGSLDLSGGGRVYNNGGGSYAVMSGGAVSVGTLSGDTQTYPYTTMRPDGFNIYRNGTTGIGTVNFDIFNNLALSSPGDVNLLGGQNAEINALNGSVKAHSVLDIEMIAGREFHVYTYGTLEYAQRILDNGNVYFPRHDYTTTAESNVRLDSSGHLRRNASRSEYKLSQRDIPVDRLLGLLSLQPKTWFDSSNSEALAAAIESEDPEELNLVEPVRRIPGLVAEEVEATGLTEFVEYGAEGRLQGVQYTRIGVMWIPIVKQLMDRVSELEARLVAP